jgi:hypothetical protein
MEIYQWLFRQNEFPVSATGYFVYMNGRRDAETFDNKLEFAAKIIPYEGDDGWIDDAILAAHETLMSDIFPAVAADCDYCTYRSIAREAESSASAV